MLLCRDSKVSTVPVIPGQSRCIDNVATLRGPHNPHSIARHESPPMQVTVKKWGNSASVRLPAAIMEAAHLKLDDTVDVREEGGVIIITPVRPGPL